VGVLEAGHARAPRGVAPSVGAIGVPEAPDALRRRRIAATLDAVGILATSHARVGDGIADPASAVLVERALHADPACGVTDPAAEAIAVAGAGDARVRRRVADLVGRTLLATPALHARVRAGEADAARAVLVVEAGHAAIRGPIARPAGALSVFGTLDAAAPREVAHADFAMLRRDAIDAHAARRIAVARRPALGVLDTLPAQAPELGPAARRGRTGIVVRRTGGRTARPHRIADLPGGTRHGRARLAWPTESVGRQTMPVGALEADLTGLVAFAGPGTETAILEVYAGRARPGALVVRVAAGARRPPERSALAGLRIAVLGFGARPGDPAIGLERHAEALGDLAALAERTVVLRSASPGREQATTRRQVARPEGAVAVGRTLPRRGVSFRTRAGIGRRLRRIGAAAEGHARAHDPQKRPDDRCPAGRAAVNEESSSPQLQTWPPGPEPPDIGPGGPSVHGTGTRDERRVVSVSFFGRHLSRNTTIAESVRAARPPHLTRRGRARPTGSPRASAATLDFGRAASDEERRRRPLFVAPVVAEFATA
jgi:hypothetical protein